MRAPTVTPTLSMARPSAPVPRDTRGQPAARTWTNVHWVGAGSWAKRPALEDTGGGGGQGLQWPLTTTSHQAPTPVSTRASASTRWAPSSASVCRATRAPAARSMSTSASRTPVRTMPPAWTRSGSSSASVCPVRPASHPRPGAQGAGAQPRLDSLRGSLWAHWPHLRFLGWGAFGETEAGLTEQQRGTKPSRWVSAGPAGAQV